MTSLSFSHKQRLLNAADYTAVFNHVEVKISHPSFSLLARRQADSSTARLGLIAAKKNLRHAVQRNRFKRLVRESFRHHQQELAGIELVVMARSNAASLSTAELRAALDQAWPRLLKRLQQVQTAPTHASG